MDDMVEKQRFALYHQMTDEGVAHVEFSISRLHHDKVAVSSMFRHAFAVGQPRDAQPAAQGQLVGVDALFLDKIALNI